MFLLSLNHFSSVVSILIDKPEMPIKPQYQLAVLVVFDSMSESLASCMSYFRRPSFKQGSTYKFVLSYFQHIDIHMRIQIL